jgi:hypothetical protein
MVLASCANVSVAGIWEGKENELPAVELTLRNDNGQISGTLGFYFKLVAAMANGIQTENHHS